MPVRAPACVASAGVPNRLGRVIRAVRQRRQRRSPPWLCAVAPPRGAGGSRVPPACSGAPPPSPGVPGQSTVLGPPGAAPPWAVAAVSGAAPGGSMDFIIKLQNRILYEAEIAI